MDWTQTFFLIVGAGMCLVVTGQLVIWSLQTYSWRSESQQKFRQWQTAKRSQINNEAEKKRESTRKAESESVLDHWQGWRKFRVTRIEQESRNSRSVYLSPVDQKKIASWLPGQFLTIQLNLPGGAKPMVRCYSISSGFVNSGPTPVSSNSPTSYRITVKQVDYSNQPQRVSASRFLTQQLIVGDVIDVKPPNGDFTLDTHTDAPLVMLSAGVGITPIYSMIEWVTVHQPLRKVLLLYGNRNSTDHIFRQRLAQLAARNSNLHVLNCYSDPGNSDRLGTDYQVGGHVSVELLKKILPHQFFQFYLCGPAGFMQSLFNDLLDWGVPESRIFYEAFGPASVKKVAEEISSSHTNNSVPAAAKQVTVTFATSKRTAICTRETQTLLDLGLESGVELDYGCCAGNCGQCTARLLKGKIHYLDRPTAEIPPGHCLPCIACPDTEVELEV